MPNTLPFILRTAWRDSRRSRTRLLLFLSAIVAGVAALTAVSSFSNNLRNDIDRESRSLLGADVSLEANAPIADSLLAPFRATGAVEARVTNFASMVRFHRGGGTRMVDVRAIEGDFPFYGKWKTAPESAKSAYRAPGAYRALAEHPLFVQFGLRPGDSMQLGNAVFTVAGDLLAAPGRAGIAGGIAPVVNIPAYSLPATGLIQPGSRVEYRYYFKMPEGLSADSLLDKHAKTLDAAKIDWETVSSRKENVGEAFGDFGTFLNLTGFIALLLGCIGIAGAVQLYIREKIPTVAILRCLGASGRQAFAVFLVQIIVAGLVGGLLGALTGGTLQKLLPAVMADFLPIEEVSTDLSPLILLRGTLLGLAASVLFALPPLGSILSVSPMRTMQVAVTDERAGLRWRVISYLCIAAYLALTARWILGDWKDTAFFAAGISAALLLLYGTAKGLIWAIRRFFPKNGSFTLRHAIANLYRPNNRTVLLSVTIGIGTMLLSTLFLVQQLILGQVSFKGSGTQPNMVLFDIQTHQKDSLHRMAAAYGLPILQDVPVITLRIDKLKGLRKSDVKRDSFPDRRETGEERRARHERQREDSTHISGWVWDREYRVTYRDTLIDSEKLSEGEWVGTYAGTGAVPVSISTRFADAAKLKVGDTVLYNVQGLPLETVVGSIREVDFARIQTNFMVVFPNGVLEDAPKFHVLISRTDSAEQSVAFQSEAVARFPNISAIDLTQILRSLDEVLGKVSFVIRFMALFSILTGFLVLISSIYQSKYARSRESVLLRTLGAGRRQISGIATLEYLILGGLAAGVGILLSIAAAFALAVRVFDIPFRFDPLPLLGIFALITGLVALLGLTFSRSAVNRPPLEVLRSEVG